MKRLACLFAVLLFAGTAWTQPERTPPPEPQQTEQQPQAFNRPHVFGCGMIWASWLGRDWSYDGQSMDRIVQMGGTATRATFDWVSLERTRGNWDWAYADHQVEQAQARGLAQFAYIGNTPAWALPPGWPANLGYRHPPDEAYAADFQNYCRTVAARYRGRVKYYFVWNEPNGCSWVNDGCRNADGYPLYTRWLKRAYVALKEGDPDCIVAAGALDYNEGVSDGWRYIEGMYNEGAKGYFDAISIHPYASSGLHWRAVHDTRQVMVNHGDGHKPIIIGEYGWANSSGQDAAQKLVQFLTTITQPQYDYVILCNYLCITDLPNSTEYGLCTRNLTPRPIWNAYRDFPKNLETSTPTPTGPTPTPTNSRTPTHTPRPGQLINGDFEGGFVPAPAPFQDDPNYPRVAAVGWSLWGRNWWKDSGRDGTVYHSPTGCQSIGTNWGRLDNALYQRVTVVPGTRCRMTAWTLLEVGGPGGNRLWRAIGIDPLGGTDPSAASVIYAPQNWAEGAWQATSVECVAQTNAVTVFVRCKTERSEYWQWCHIDDVSLELLDLPPTETPTPIRTDTPSPTDHATLGTY